MSETVDLAHAAGPEGMRIFAIGDVHGKLDLLEDMHARIHADIAANPTRDWRIVHLGDYVDRGPDSKGVLDFLVAAAGRDNRVLAVLGNHDEGFLEFLTYADPVGIFAMHGGVQTALSYGVTIDFEDPVSVNTGFTALNRAVPQAHVDFIKRLPRAVSFGDFFFCHAGIRPGVALDRQDPEDLIWIRRDFLNDKRLHPKVIVHGHTPSSRPELLPNRVNVDTRAFQTGRLTALVIDGNEKRLIEATL